MNVSVEEGSGKEYHVSIKGDDTQDGSASNPLKTISAAVALAMPGDVITVHEGIYRERINPLRGGETDEKRIVFQAAEDENVEIKGSEVISNWDWVEGNVWKVTIRNEFFNDFNPYSDLIQGGWFDSKGRDHHTGAVYLNGDWLIEAADLKDVFNNQDESMLWFGRIDDNHTTIWADFNGVNPNGEFVEINVRQSLFYPEKPGINYITVRGFIMRHAATPWAPPTSEQVGLIGTHWSKGWIIENNVISHSRCTGITLGKYSDEWDNEGSSAAAFTETISRALKNGWNWENIGRHMIRNNRITHCEQAGIVGSMGAINSKIVGNIIHDIHVQCTFAGKEMAGIKLHGPLETLISGNCIFRTFRGIWLDWMTQGLRVTRNLLYQNMEDDLYVEVNHGPFLVDNNLFLSENSKNTVNNKSQGGAYAHNLIVGGVFVKPIRNRFTPFHYAHSTKIAGHSNIEGGDDRYYNNIFVAQKDYNGLSVYDEVTKFPVFMDGNSFLKGAQPSVHEKAPLEVHHFDPEIKLIQEKEVIYLHLTFDIDWKNQRKRKLVTTKRLGKTQVSELPFVDVDDKQIRMDCDYFDRHRDATNPFPGPFELTGEDKIVLKVWPQ